MKSRLYEMVEDSENSIEASLMEKENKSIFENVIRKLPRQQRFVYQLAKQEGMSRKEIGERLKISPNTVKNHLLVAVHFIRNCFKNDNTIIVWLLILIQF